MPDRTSRDLPPLAEENHVCVGCALSYSELTVDAALDVVRGVPDLLRATVEGIDPRWRRTRPEPDVWSVTEYAAHVRDVCVGFTIRLYRSRTEADPQVEPMLAELRAERFAYNDLDLSGVYAELSAGAAGLVTEAGQLVGDDWLRTVHRRPTEVRTARWLVRQAAHEGAHHLRDIAAVAARVREAGG